MTDHDPQHNSAPGRIRDRQVGQHSRVTFFELFFDLVFVFAITQLAHSLAGHFDRQGLIETTLLLLAIWWVWIYTTWATNWLNPENVSVRLMLAAMMLGGLIMSAAIPEAFGDRALAFAIPFVAIQVGRSAFVAFAIREDEARRLNFIRITIWMAFSGVFWIGGALADDDLRLGMWVVALAIEYAGPTARYWVPAYGASNVTDWNVEGEHFAERCGLFMIIALGESLLITGATFSGLPWETELVVGMVSAFVTAVALWWIYFDTTAGAGSHLIAHSDDPGRIGRLAYTYIHIPMVAGIIFTAVGDEKILAHPTGSTEFGVALVILGGPALFLLGHWLFKRAIAGHFVVHHLVGITALGLALAAYQQLPPYLLSVVATVILVGVAASLRLVRHPEPTATAA